VHPDDAVRFVSHSALGAARGAAEGVIVGALLAHICELIRKNGPLSVADYMELALQHPEFGYYRHGDPLGLAGDFITAPEVSQMFGEMIGLWCADVWRQMGAPDKFALVELGPGRGTLMQDALRAMGKISGFHQAMQLCLMESSETLRKEQQKKLSDHEPRYIDNLSQLPDLPTLVIANEFFDALPVRQFEKTFQGWHERLVTLDGGRLAFTTRQLDAPMLMLIPGPMRDAPPGTVYEISMPALVMMRDLARHIAGQGGAALVIDYGYAESDGKPTLQAVSGHTYADALAAPGEADITTHVDFGALQKAAQIQNVTVQGPVAQGEFLQTLGIELRAAQLKRHATPEQAKDIDAALHRLTDASQMGSLFKAIAIASPLLSELPGF
jgi:NADH dehydrogenase [ubiquinone] 1 alpha subcomplex assembly factor 7